MWMKQGLSPQSIGRATTSTSLLEQQVAHSHGSMAPAVPRCVDHANSGCPSSGTLCCVSINLLVCSFCCPLGWCYARNLKNS